MNILAIESATTVCGTALFLDNQMTGFDEINIPRVHGEKLPIMVNRILDKFTIQTIDLDGIAISSGPGSYTGLRIGMSLAKGLAAPVKIPIIPISTLEVINEGVDRKGLYTILLHSHKDVVFEQTFNSGKIKSEVISAKFDKDKYNKPIGFNLDLMGDDIDYESVSPSSVNLGKLAMRYFDDLAEKNLKVITPNYITSFNSKIISSN